MPPPAAPPSPPADGDERLIPALAAYLLDASSRNAFASASEPYRDAGSIVIARRRTPSCLPDPRPHLVSRCFLTEPILKPPGIFDETSRATNELDCLPSWPLNVACIEAPNSSSGVSSGFSGVDPNSLPRSPSISFCRVDFPALKVRKYLQNFGWELASNKVFDGLAKGNVGYRLLQFLSYQRP